MAKTVRIEIFYDDEVATGLIEPAYQFLPEGAVIDAPEAAAKSLIEGRQARATKAKANVDLSAPDKIPAAIDKILAERPEEGADDEPEA